MNSLLQFINSNINPNNQELALSALEELLQFKETDNAFYSCGLISANLRDFNKSFYYYNKALEINPNHKQSLFDLGALNSFLGNWDNSIYFGERLIQIDHNYNDILVHVANTYSAMGNHESSINHFKRAIDLNPFNLIAWSDLFLSLNYVNIDIDERISLRDKFSVFFSPLVKKPQPMINNNCKIKIGYVSSDFRNHAVSYFTKGLITKHNKDKFDVYYYGLSPIEDDITEIFKLSGGFKNCSNLSSEELIRVIKEDKIDILIDLNGFTQSNKIHIFLEHPAPIQMTWLGFLNSMGVPSIKYKISDESMIEEKSEKLYSEDILKLKNSLVYDPPSNYPDIIDLPYCNNGFITFGYFNNLKKLNVNVLNKWIQIFKTHENCKLIMIKSKFERLNETIASYFTSKGFFNFEFKSESSLYNFMKYMSEVDVALDPFPHSGGATTAHCLWMGVPVLTIQGKLEFERISSSISKLFELYDFIAYDEEDYIAKGTNINIENLKHIRKNIRSKFPSADSVIHELEEKFENMVKNHII